MMRTATCLLLALYAAGMVAAEAGEHRYTYLTVGEPSGFQIARYDGEGGVRIDFEFTDRGRCVGRCYSGRRIEGE